MREVKLDVRIFCFICDYKEKNVPLSDCGNTWNLVSLEKDQQKRVLVAPFHGPLAEAMICFEKLL